MKIAIVVPRFGEGISGGAEKHAMDYALLLSEKHQVDVLTTTAVDYFSWNNHYKEGVEVYKKINIYRFQVDKKRNIRSFNKLLNRFYQKPKNLTESEFHSYLNMQGPVSSGLLNFIERDHSKYNVFIFFTYLYATTVYGISKVKNKSILVPTLHKEPTIYFPDYQKILTNEITYCFNSQEELNLFVNVFNFIPDKKSIIGTFVKPIEVSNNLTIQYKDYFLYIGRIDITKGIIPLIDYFTEWIDKRDIKADLLFIGNGEAINREHRNVHFLGYTSEEDKINYIKSSIALINPSLYESLSIVVLESWAYKTPVIVNRYCLPLKEHCEQSNGGLYYSDKDTFFAVMDYIWKNTKMRKYLGENGYTYTMQNYSKPVIKEKLNSLISRF